jgi:hypothetical protein
MRLYEVLTNSQSRELGWSTGVHINTTISFLCTLHFVGLMEHMAHTRKLLKYKLRWPTPLLDDDYVVVQKGGLHVARARSSARMNRKSKRLVSTLTDDELHKLKVIQWADLLVYDEGRRIFNTYHND